MTTRSDHAEGQEPDAFADAFTDDVEAILHRQDEAMALLERLRAEEPYIAPNAGHGVGGGRRDFRRWPTPQGVTLEVHDGLKWHRIDCTDMGVGGVRIENAPEWLEGPLPARLKAPGIGSILVLADVMWRDKAKKTAGLRFEFQDLEERELWSGGLIDALLAPYSLG